jgi:hypothetical protein
MTETSNQVTVSLVERDGKYFIERPGQDAEPVSELEAQRLLVSLVERGQIDQLLEQLLQTVGLDELSLEIKKQIAANAHREARRQGLTRTGAVDLRKLIGE